MDMEATLMYMPDTIDINANDPNRIGAFFGSIASKYAYKPELRSFIDHLTDVAKHSSNRHFVIEGTTVKAAQSSRSSALDYISPSRVLVSIEC